MKKESNDDDIKIIIRQLLESEISLQSINTFEKLTQTLQILLVKQKQLINQINSPEQKIQNFNYESFQQRRRISKQKDEERKKISLLVDELRQKIWKLQDEQCQRIRQLHKAQLKQQVTKNNKKADAQLLKNKKTQTQSGIFEYLHKILRFKPQQGSEYEALSGSQKQCQLKFFEKKVK